MKTTNQHWLPIVALAGIALGSCTTNHQYSSIEVEKLIAPVASELLDAAGALATCSYTPATLEQSLQVFNVSRDFYIGIVVQNNLQNNADVALGRLNTHDFIVSQAVTTYESTDGSLVDIPKQITPTQGTIAAAGQAVVAATIIPAAVAAKLATVTSVRLHMHLEGHLLDGTDVSSDEYMPIAVPTTSDFDSSSCQSPQ